MSILAFGDSGGLGVDTAIGLQAYDNNTTMLFFSMVGMFQLPCGQPGAVEQPFSEADGDGLRRLVPSQFLFVCMLVGFRHALKMHACDSGCSILDGIGMVHSSSNRWYLLGRKEGYPCRSGQYFGDCGCGGRRVGDGGGMAVIGWYLFHVFFFP